MKRPALFLLLTFTAASLSAKPLPADDKVWVIVRPVQCLDNPWEKEWMAHHHNQAAKYPRAHEVDIIKSYFARQNVPVLEIRSKPHINGDPVCPTCNCSRGDVLYLLMHAPYVQKMVKMGYTERVANSEVPTPAKKK